MIRAVRLSVAVLTLSAVAACGSDADAPAPADAPLTSETAAADATAEAPLSPRDTTRATVADAEIFVDYGRPSMRGRTIMGELVPYGAVWRTGANEATTLVTPVDLRIGNADVPAGVYTLYTIPESDRWTLIVNRQTGQWGTVYDEGSDLARIPMTVSSLDTPVEQLTFHLVPEGDRAGTLALEWERTRAEVPFTVVSR